MRILLTRLIVYAIMALLVPTSPAVSASAVELWPEGWSEMVPLFETSIFGDRFAVRADSAGTSFVSADGTYYRRLNLTYRLFDESKLEKEIVLAEQSEVDSPSLLIDELGGRHVFWLEHQDNDSAIMYGHLDADGSGIEVIDLWTTSNDVQDLDAYLDSSGVIHLVWSEREQFFQVNYAVLEFSRLANIDQVTHSEAPSIRPTVVVDSDGTPHLTYFESSQRGVDVMYSTKGNDGWSQPTVLGAGSAQEIQHGGSIAMVVRPNSIDVSWAGVPKNSATPHLYITRIESDGKIESPVQLVPGSRPRFVEDGEDQVIFWQASGPYGSQIHYGVYEGGQLVQHTNLTIGRKAAFRPEAIKTEEGFLRTFFLQHLDGARYEVQTMNNQYPKSISVWSRMGIDEEAPAANIAFVLGVTLMLSLVYMVTNGGALIIGGVMFFLLMRVPRFRKQTLMYRTILAGAILAVLQLLPIPALRPEFYGLLHYILSFLLASIGAFMLARLSGKEGSFTNITLFLFWMWLFQFFRLIPQTILSV